jgi:cyclic beta-1,2-glucan synthetase
VGIYKSEPYVMAADIYSQAPHVGRGGWTWYTGSAGWMYRAGMEFILGIHQEGKNMRFDPRIPKAWPGFKVIYQFGETPAMEIKTPSHDWDLPIPTKTVGTTYEIQFENPNHVSQGVQHIELDGKMVETDDATIELKDDQQKHLVKVVMI